MALSSTFPSPEIRPALFRARTGNVICGLWGHSDWECTEALASGRPPWAPATFKTRWLLFPWGTASTAHAPTNAAEQILQLFLSAREDFSLLPSAALRQLRSCHPRRFPASGAGQQHGAAPHSYLGCSRARSH